MKLASIEKILKLSPIDGADRVETAHILGWTVVVKKGEFSVGDLVVYIPIDTVVPETPVFEFLRDRKFRVKTIKLRGQLSQGLIVPKEYFNISNPKEGQDVGSIVGVKKYEKPDNNPTYTETTLWEKIKRFLFPRLGKGSRSPFPTHLLPITDEERIQNIPEVLKKYRYKLFSVSHKMDGSSITIIHYKNIFGKSKYRICSRRFELHDKDNDWYKVFKSTNFEVHIRDLVKQYGTNDIMVQGEAIGKFNGNHHKLQDNQIRLFNIFVKGKRLPPESFNNVCELLNIPRCPLYGLVTLNHSMEEILKVSEVKDVLNPDAEGEGLVWRCGEDDFSFKVINNKYLIKEK